MRLVLAAVLCACAVVSCGGSSTPGGGQNAPGDSRNELACAQAQDYADQLRQLGFQQSDIDPYTTDPTLIQERSRQNADKGREMNRLRNLQQVAAKTCSGR